MNLDGLRKLLGQAGKAVGQAVQAPAAAGAALGRLMNGQPQAPALPQVMHEPRQMPGLQRPIQPIQPMPRMQPMAPMGGTTISARVGYNTPAGMPTDMQPRYGEQEDDGMVWGPRGMQPLNQIQPGEPWQNASGPYRPRY